MPEYETMLYSKEGSFLSPAKNTALIKFNRLDALNAINGQFLQDLNDALDEAEKDKDRQVFPQQVVHPRLPWCYSRPSHIDESAPEDAAR
ncbi:MAG: hypothetical protein ACFFB7_05750, partial [Candidatus Sifarchaeia archaeon]